MSSGQKYRRTSELGTLKRDEVFSHVLVNSVKVEGSQGVVERTLVPAKSFTVKDSKNEKIQRLFDLVDSITGGKIIIPVGARNLQVVVKSNHNLAEECSFVLGFYSSEPGVNEEALAQRVTSTKDPITGATLNQCKVIGYNLSLGSAAYAQLCGVLGLESDVGQNSAATFGEPAALHPCISVLTPELLVGDICVTVSYVPLSCNSQE